MRELVDSAHSLATQFVERYLGILEDGKLLPQQKQAQVATLRASLRTHFESCLRLLLEQEDYRADEWRDPFFDKIARTINSLSMYFNTDGHISE